MPKVVETYKNEAREDLDKTLEEIRRKRFKQHTHPRLEEIKLGE